MHIAIIAGEMSGDILGAGLMQTLKQAYPEIHFSGIGGALMQQQGLHSIVPMERLSVMGLVEVLSRLPELLKLRKSLIQRWLTNPPDLFIGIDAPDFNLVIEEKLKQQGILTCHYVSPSVWAWKAWRIKQIKRACDLMLTLFPFELPIYEQAGISAQCVGHTLADSIALENDPKPARAKLNLPDDVLIVCLMPGSRGSEVKYLGATFLQAAQQIQQKEKDTVFILPAANAMRLQQLQNLIADYPKLNIKLLSGQAQTAMIAADVILLASGTATLEAMLVKRPMVVSYKMAWLTHFILKRMITKPYISLPNLLAEKPLVAEILQDEATPQALAQAVLDLLKNPEKSNELKQEFSRLHRSIKRDANQQAAYAIKTLLDKHGKS